MNLLKQLAHLYLMLQLIWAQQSSLFYSAFTTNDFITSESWLVQNISPGDIYSVCDGIRLFGGYNLFGSTVSIMKMLQLPPHFKVQIKLQFWKIDGWDGESLYIYLDQSLASQISYANDGTPKCGNQYNEIFTNIDITQSHSYYSIYIYITTALNEAFSDESWGIRDFYLYVYLCPIGCLTCEENDQIIQCIPWILLNSAFLSITQSQFSYDGWFINNQFQQTSLCGDIPLFGGYQITGQNSIIQTTINLPVHQLLKIQIEVAFIDSWSNEYLYIDIDNQIVISQKYKSRIGFGIENICGDNLRQDRMQNFQFYLSHSQSQLQIKISTNLDENTSDESFGIRDFQLFSYNQLCGNEIIEDNEQCDDGNLEPFDGCFMCQYSCADGCSYCLSGECLETLESKQISEASSSQLNYSKCDNDNLVQFDGCFNNQHSCPEYCSTCVKGECLVCYKQLWMLYQSQCFPECLKGNQNDIAIINQELHQFQNQDCFNCFCMIQQTYSQQCTLNCNYNLKCAECNLKCNEHCQDCQNGICKNCIYAYQLNNNKCLPICGDGLIAEDFEQCDDMNNIPYDGCFECQYQCDINCLNCLNGVCQDECKIGYRYMNNECVEICGDGIIAGQEECEDYEQLKSQNCKNCKLICPQNCYECEYGNCQICNSGYNLDQKQNICIPKYDSTDNNLDFDGCYDLCNGELNNLCQVCKLSSQPYIILTYLGQIDNLQNILLTFSQDIKLQSDTNLIDHLNLQIIEDVDANSYQINVIAVRDATKNQASNVEYQIQINFNSSIREFRYLKVKVETIILNEYNVELINYSQKIMLSSYMQPSEDLINKSNQGKRMNQILSGSLGILAILALIIGQQNLFLSLLQILQFQSYLKFINIKFPFNIMVYFEGNIVQVSYILRLLNIQKFIKITLIPFERFQISYQKFLYYQINSDLLSNFEGQIYQIFSLIISLVFMWFLQKFLQYLFKLPSNTNLRVLRLLFFLQRYTFNFIKSYNLQSLTTVLRVNSWDLIFIAGLQVQCAKDTSKYMFKLASQNTIQDIIGYLIIFGYIYLCFSDFFYGNRISKSSKQFWQSKHQSMILLQKISFLIVLIELQFQKVMQILLLSTIQLTYLVYLFVIQPLENKLELINSIQMEISVLIFVLSSIFYCEMFSALIDFESQIIIGWCQISIFLSVLIARLLIELKQNQFLKKIILLLKTNNLNLEANPHPLDNQN